MTLTLDHSYATLPARFFSKQAPDPVASPTLIKTNSDLASLLNIDTKWLTSEEAIGYFSGNSLPPEIQSISTVYAGHQFGTWNPQLGDGRAVLLGERKGKDGQLYDIQLKGAGRTPYSRGGDGRSPLGPVLREYILSEAMHALGVPTTRSLAAVETGEQVYRETALPGAILTRVASSHIRVGTFQFFSARQDIEAVKTLYKYAAKRHFLETLEAENPVLAFLDAVIEKQAELIAKWQCLGFIHGVMNTDNMLICGETVDYGPCAFMDTFSAKAVFSSIDHHGRYRYENQPKIAHWNLSWLAQSLLPLLHDDQEKAVEVAQEAIDQFPKKYTQAYQLGMAKKLGFESASETTVKLSDEFLHLLEKNAIDFTLGFRQLADLITSDRQVEIPEHRLPKAFDKWLEEWRFALQSEHDMENITQSIRSTNPIFIPRNHLVEQAIHSAEYENSYAPFEQLVDLLSSPFEFNLASGDFALPASDKERVYRTFCGT